MTRVYVIIALVAALVAGGYAWFRDHNQKVARIAIAHERIRNDSIIIASIRDSLNDAGRAVDTSTVLVKRAIAVYDTSRKHVVLTDTSRFVIVDTQFVHAADSVRNACSLLELDCAKYKKFADSTIKAQGRVITNLQLVDDKKSSGWLGKSISFALGGGVGYGVCRATK